MYQLIKQYPRLQYALALFGGAALALASFLPETWVSVFGGLLCAMAFSIVLDSSSRPIWAAYLGGLFFYILAVVWLADTLSFFGGFPSAVSWTLFLLFSALSALQFALAGWIFVRINRGILAGLCLSFPVAWTLSELLVPRMFPWALGHALVRVDILSAIAELGGAQAASMLICFMGQGLALAMFKRARDRRYALGLTSILIALCVSWGIVRGARLEAELETAPRVKTALIQGNLEAKQKGNARYFDVNLKRYQELSTRALEQGAEIIFWPESVLNVWTPEELRNVRGTNVDPFPGLPVPLVYGTLAYRERTEAELKEIIEREGRENVDSEVRRYHRFNAGLGINAEGQILGRYYKKVLMPFGEFLPFANIFPALRKLSPNTGDFSRGDFDAPFVIPLKETVMRAAILICYEDLVPSLSRVAVEHDANILVNLTNDAWYGDTAAPHQHHLLAQWRAIESRRFLLRVTNTGFTAVVSPAGRVVASLPVFEEGVLLSEVSLLSSQTFYAHWGDLPLWMICITFLALGMLSNKIRNFPE